MGKHIKAKSQGSSNNFFQQLGKPPKKKSKKTSQQVWTISKNGEPPLPLFHNNFSRFRNLKINVFLQLLRVCEWGGLAKSLSKISLKSSSKQTDYEKFSSLWTKIWYCSGEVLPGRIFEFSIRSEIRHGRIRIFY